MINETIQIAQKVSFEQIVAVTQSTPFIIIQLVIWLLPMFIYIFVASITKARRSNGAKMKRSMITSGHAWIPILIWFFVQGALILFLQIIPFWAGAFN